MKKLIITAIAALAFAAPAAYAAMPVTITSTSSVNRHPQVTWALPSGWTPNVIDIAKAPDVASDGSFFTENIVDAGILQPGQTTFLSASQLDPGTYYVRLQAYADDFSEIGWTDTATLIIAAPPPPPPPPVARYRIDVTTLTGAKLTTLRMGQLVEVELDIQPLEARFLSTAKRHLCIRLRTGVSCSTKLLRFPVVARNNTINGLFTVYATEDDKVVAKRVLPVRTR